VLKVPRHEDVLGSVDKAPRIIKAYEWLLLCIIITAFAFGISLSVCEL